MRLSYIIALTLALALPACTADTETDDAAALAQSAGRTDVRRASTQGSSPENAGATAPRACLEARELALAIESAAPVAAPDTLDTALRGIDQDRSSFGLSTEATATSRLRIDDARMLSAARDALARPLGLPKYGRRVGAALDAAATSDAPVSSAIFAAAALRDEPIAPPCLLDVESAPSRGRAGDLPLADVLATMRKTSRDAAEVSRIPVELQRALAPILETAAWAAREIESARAPARRFGEALSAMPAYMGGIRHFQWSPELVSAFEAVDMKRITQASAAVSFAIERAELGRFASIDLEPLELRTPLGSLVLRGGRADTWESSDEAPLLLLDTGGDDTYRGSVAAATLARPVSLLVDLGGNDTYGYVEVPRADDPPGLPSDGSGRLERRTRSRIGRQGSAVLGVGLAFDLGAGDDRYRSLSASQGSASHGVAVLYDDGGNDSYEAEVFSQGAAAWGIGILLDRGGDDRYRLLHAGQGFGFTRGVGAIIDVAGKDHYVADPGLRSLGGTSIYENALVADTNFSLAQGCGVGQRPDAPAPGYPLPGGMGILRDAAGDDRYEVGVYGQGCGFVQGLGLLLEGGGADTYDGIYYVQGIAAHLAAALFLEEGGSDRYDTTFPIQGPSLGFGNDLAVAVHLDAAGDDVYRAASFCLGASQANGASVFVDAGGDDRFDVAGAEAFGAARTTTVRAERSALPTYGVFVKAGGEASYQVAGTPFARAGTTWRGPSTAATDLGIAIDRPLGAASF